MSTVADAACRPLCSCDLFSFFFLLAAATHAQLQPRSERQFSSLVLIHQCPRPAPTHACPNSRLGFGLTPSVTPSRLAINACAVRSLPSPHPFDFFPQFPFCNALCGVWIAHKSAVLHSWIKGPVGKGTLGKPAAGKLGGKGAAGPMQHKFRRMRLVWRGFGKKAGESQGLRERAGGAGGERRLLSKLCGQHAAPDERDGKSSRQASVAGVVVVAGRAHETAGVAGAK